MKKPILSVLDEKGNVIPIRSIQGRPGITPHIGENGNWWLGDTDTGISVYKLPHPLVIMQGMKEVMYDGSEEVVVDLSDSSGGGSPPIEEDAPTTDSSGGIALKPGNALELADDGTLNVKTTDNAEQNNTLPITSAGVHTIVGNIGAILDTI